VGQDEGFYLPACHKLIVAGKPKTRLNITMKRLTTFTFIFTVSFATFGQTYEPEILILSPNEFKFEKSFETELKTKNKEISNRPKNSKQADFTKSEEFKKQPENVQRITLSEITFLKNLDFSKQASFIAQQYLSYRFFERFNNLLILPSNEKSDGSMADLKRIADTEKMQYILNFSRIDLFKKGGISYAKFSIQLYDNASTTFVINSDFEGDWRNPGFEFACADKSLDCTVNNALSKALNEVIYQISSNSPTIKRDRELAQLRFNELITNYYSRPNNKEFLEPIIPQPDSNVVLTNQYQLLIDPTKSKFVAFFIEQIQAQDFKTLKDNKKDKNVSIISSKDIKDPGLLNEIPQAYAYIVKGVKYNNKWYYEKSNVTYFEAKSLEDGKQKYFGTLAKWNFFKENSTEFDQGFWETYFFEKVESSVAKKNKEIEEIKSQLDKSSAEDRETYQEMIDDYYEEDLKNKEYFGLYEIVANQIRLEKRRLDEQFSESIRLEFLPRFYEGFCKKNNINGYIKLNGKDIQLIFPRDKSVILSPIVLDYGNDKKELNFFVLIPRGAKSFDIFKWNYFKPIKPEYGNMYGQEINEQLNQVTKWNFSFDTLDDKNFWDNFVLLKSATDYKYLSKIN
jgi:hypothetical protein